MSLILRTNKVKKTILFSSLNLFLVMILFSCTNDDLEIKNSSSVINQLKRELKLDDFSQKNFAKNIVVNWETITTLETEQLTIYKVQISEKNQTNIESNIFQAPLKYGLIAIKKGELMHSYLIEAYSSINHSLYTNKIDDLAQFTGTLSVYELSGKFIGQLVVFNGKSTNPSKNNKLTLLDETINSFYISKNTTSKVPLCNITQFVQIINVHETRHYVPTIIVGTYTNWGYSYSTYTTTITGTYMSVPYPCDADADYLHVPYRVTTYEDVYDLPIIINNLTGKAKCLNDLLDKKGNSFIQNLLANFKGEKSDFSIKIESADVVSSSDNKKEINGSTTAPFNKTILIKISTSRANEHPNLVVARSILHEYIHADIYRKTPILHNSNDMPDFKKTYETYGDVYHHNNMAEFYLNSMKNALKAFHKDVLTSDYNKYKDYYGEPNDTFYEAIAWGGLAEANPDAWVKLDAAKKQEITNLMARIGMLSKISPCPN